jgi:predicted nuclease of restriction endonuclease-like (RecB) superfamily
MSLAASDYPNFLAKLKDEIRQARLQAMLSVNRELVLLYWQIGQAIIEAQQQQGWGASVIDQLASDLKKEFPEMRGFSARNLRYMRRFGLAYTEPSLLQQVVANLPWGHHCTLLDDLDTPAEREWYMRACIENGWSRAVLKVQIESRLHLRLGNAPHNFTHTLPPVQSDLARHVFKDPYNIDFLDATKILSERDLERGLLAKIRDFLLELGSGFAFVGSQKQLQVDQQDFYIDLLFYHLKLRCYIVIELKMDEFKPEYAGKLNFYLKVVDDLMRTPEDKPTIGLLLTKTYSKNVAMYALSGMSQPMAVARWTLPEELQKFLPTAQQLEELLKEEGGDAAITANE